MKAWPPLLPLQRFNVLNYRNYTRSGSRSQGIYAIFTMPVARRAAVDGGGDGYCSRGRPCGTKGNLASQWGVGNREWRINGGSAAISGISSRSGLQAPTPAKTNLPQGPNEWRQGRRWKAVSRGLRQADSAPSSISLCVGHIAPFTPVLRAGRLFIPHSPFTPLPAPHSPLISRREQ